MKLTASPFDATTGALLPVYRDAYLRGDLTAANSTAVDAYLQADRPLSDDTFSRFHQLRQQGEAVQPVGWMHRQLELIRTEPQRFRQRAATLVAAAVLVAGAAMAATHEPATASTDAGAPVVVVEATPGDVEMVAAIPTAMTTVRGRILDENGRPLVGATVLSKQSGRGVATDANGAYAFRLPAAQAAAGRLQIGYGGYVDDEIELKGSTIQNVTLVPRAAVKRPRHWLFF
ncbi:hypothetical protein GCM10027422_37470 [Hymenobacter arcticus]